MVTPTECKAVAAHTQFTLVEFGFLTPDDRYIVTHPSRRSDYDRSPEDLALHLARSYGEVSIYGDTVEVIRPAAEDGARQVVRHRFVKGSQAFARDAA